MSDIKLTHDPLSLLMRKRLILVVLIVVIPSLFICKATSAQSIKKRNSDPPSQTSASPLGRIVVGRNVMVSKGHPGWEHTEYVADSDPFDPNRLMVCSMRFSQVQNQLTTGIYVTSDRGRNWMLSYEDRGSRFMGVWDPACSYGVNGLAFLVTLVVPDTAPGRPNQRLYKFWTMPGDRVTHVYRSSDGGRTWEAPTEMSKLDREDLKIDRTNSPYRGRMYLYGATPDPTMWLIYSSDNGRTWVRSAETRVEGSVDEFGPGTILPDGTLLLPYRHTIRPSDKTSGTTSIEVAASTDGGAHIGLPVSVAAWHGGCAGLAGMASDHSAGRFRGRAYLMWGEKHRGRCVVLVSHSDDRGLTWSTPVEATVGSYRSPKTEALHKLMPQIAVNKEGIVGVAWFELRQHSIGYGHRLRFSASLDGGESWLRSVPVSAHSFVVKHRPEFAATAVVSGGGRRPEKQPTNLVDVHVWPSPRGYYPWNSWPGDYVAGITAGADGKYYAFWTDNRTGVGELYMAPVTVSGTVARHGEADLAKLEDVTSTLEIQFTSSVWESRTKTVSLEYQLLNTSRDTIVGPLKLRIVRLESDLGVPTLVFGPGRSDRGGTVLDLSHTIPRNGLRSGHTSMPQKLVVKFDNVNQLTDANKDIVHMKVKAYGRLLSASGNPR